MVRIGHPKLLLLGLTALVTGGVLLFWPATDSEPIRVGILIDADDGPARRGARDAALLALEELNARGGLLGRPLEPVVAAVSHDAGGAVAAMHRLLGTHRVRATLALGDSDFRRELLPAVASAQHLLLYPLAYEGLESHSGVVYTGMTPGQQLAPVLQWAFAHLQARRYYLVGPDDLYYEVAREVVQRQVVLFDGELVGAAKVRRDNPYLGWVARRVAAERPDVVVNLLRGPANRRLFERLHQAGVTPAETHVISFCWSEEDLPRQKWEGLAGHYVAGSYFVEADEAAVGFADQLKGRFGAGRSVDEAMESSYAAVHLWAQAVRLAGTEKPAIVGRKLAGQSLAAPSGIVCVDPESRHAWRTVRIAQVRPDARFQVEWQSLEPVSPVPFPGFRSKEAWLERRARAAAVQGPREPGPTGLTRTEATAS